MDGNSSPSWYDSSCTHTGFKDRAWWKVDLGKVEGVSEVYIVNREQSGERLSKFEIRVGRSPFVTLPATFVCTHMTSFQFLLRQLFGKKN